MAGTFKKLDAWKEAKDISVKIFKVTKDFPKEEIYVMVSQIRRAALSISNNIAEGSGSRYIDKKISQYDNAIGSSNEVENLNEIAAELWYISDENYNVINDSIEKVRKMLYGLIKSLEDQKRRNDTDITSDSIK